MIGIFIFGFCQKEGGIVEVILIVSSMLLVETTLSLKMHINFEKFTGNEWGNNCLFGISLFFVCPDDTNMFDGPFSLSLHSLRYPDHWIRALDLPWRLAWPVPIQAGLLVKLPVNLVGEVPAWEKLIGCQGMNRSAFLDRSDPDPDLFFTPDPIRDPIHIWPIRSAIQIQIQKSL